MWNVLGRLAPHDDHLNLQFEWDIAPGRTLDDVLTAVAKLLETYESLRTSYYLDDGVPKQRLHAAGSLSVSILDVAGESLDDETRQVGRNLRSTPFVLTQEIPVRAAVLMVDGHPRRGILVVSHLVTDGTGLDVLRETMAGDLTPGVPWQPQDQSLRDGTPEARRVAEKSLSYWKSRFADYPQTSFGMPPDTEQSPRWWHGRLSTRVLGVACHRLGAQLDVPASSVLGAALALFVGHRVGLDVCAFDVVVTNRFTPESKRAVGTFVQESPVVLKLAKNSFRDTIKRVNAEAAGAYPRARYAPQDVIAAIEEIDQARGTSTRIDLGMNVISGDPANLPLPEDNERAAAILRQMQAESVFDWVAKRPVEAIKCYMHAWLPGYVSLIGDTRYFSPDEIERLLRGVQSLVIEAVAGFDDPAGFLGKSGIRNFAPGANWVTLHNSWIDLQAVNAMVTQAAGARAIVLVTHGRGDTLTAYIDASDRKPDMTDFLARCRSAVKAGSSLIVPKHYSLCNGLPSKLTPESASRLRVISEGTLF